MTGGNSYLTAFTAAIGAHPWMVEVTKSGGPRAVAGNGPSGIVLQPAVP